MGRNFSAATPLATQVISDMQRFGEMLAPQDRIILKRFGEYALNNRAAIANAASLEPFEVTLLLLILDEHKQAERRMAELRAEIATLRKQLELPPGYRLRTEPRTPPPTAE